ncbi:MAG: twin-arginine translocase subunit TatC [Gammaproteobacteria bacterium]|jgi:sec-independent protein translocase protein TatC|nr:twin-arginine translocase subunit TatC [Gammaproteobacteria bacterium]
MSNAATGTLVSHLTELRRRLIYIFVSVTLVFAGLFPFANELYQFVSEPLRAYMPEGSSMIATEVASPFLTPFKLSLVLSVIIAVPLILYQFWAFIAPGLYRREKRIIAPLMASSITLFYAGMAFCYFVVFPLVFGFFTSVGPEGVTVMTDINQYLSFVIKLLFAFGIAFEIPVAVFLLAWMGIIDAHKLANKRPYVIVGCFTLGMFLTPPDVISQTLLALPMWLLFEVGSLCARMIQKPSGDSSQ